MIVIPSVELRRGKCTPPTGFAVSDPGSPLRHALAVVREWANAGFSRVHLVDADAVTGCGSNMPLVDEIIRDGAVEVETFDAAQSGEQIDRLIDAGAVRVALGPRATTDPVWLAGVADLYPGALVVVAEMRERRIVLRGRYDAPQDDILDVVAELNDLPLGGLLLRGASGDGRRTTADLAHLEDVVEACECPVIVGGGVSSMSDLRALDHRGISAVLLDDTRGRGALDPRSVALEFGE